MLAPDNRVVLITGANRGIGLAVAKHLSRLGFKLSLGVRNEDSLNLESFSNEVISHAYDASDALGVDSWVEKTRVHFGSIDAVVLNAGVMFPVGFDNGSEEELDLMWNVNFKGPWRLMRAVLPWLKQSQNGRVVNIVSLSGKRVFNSANLGYSASKFAAMALTHAIRQEGWSDGLRCTAICPGLVDTDMISQVAVPEGEYKIDPESIAATVAYALSLSNDASVAEILVNSRLEPTF